LFEGPGGEEHLPSDAGYFGLILGLFWVLGYFLLVERVLKSLINQIEWNNCEIMR